MGVLSASPHRGSTDVTSKDDIGQTKSFGGTPPAGSAGVNPPLGAEFLGVESLRAGMQLNGVYEIDALLARGGMGEVYKGHSIQTGDDVAIKVIRADLAENEVAIALFRNEASKLHRLHHEAIIRYFVFSVDPLLQRTYLAMEFVEGEPLSQMLRRGPLPAGAAQRLAQRVALGLNAAHKRDIIHRDVSSDNIIIQNGDVDEAKIIDFGIARSTAVGTTFIDVGFAGKLNYVSPEQLGLYGGEVGARSDIYSLGLVLAEALRGAPLDMGGTQVEVIEKRKSVPDLAGVDPRIAPILAKMLQPNPDDRPQSMQAVADDFARLTIEPPERARPSPARRAERRSDEAGRLLKIGAAAGGALALVTLAAGAYLWLGAPVKKPAPPPEVTLQPAPERPAVAPPPAAIPPAVAPESAPVQAPAQNSTLVTRDSILDFVERSAAAPCFSVVSVAATDSSAKIEAIGASREPFDELNAAFNKAIGFEADIRAIIIPATECAALDFYNSARKNAKLAPVVQLDAPFLRGGQALAGSISAPKDRRIEALLIGDDGLAQNVTSALSTGHPRTFSINVARPKVAAAPQLLMMISSTQPLSSLKLAKPVKTAQALSATEAEAGEKQEDLGVSLNYFYVTE